MIILCEKLQDVESKKMLKITLVSISMLSFSSLFIRSNFVLYFTNF